MFTFNNLNGSTKSNATVVCSTNSPSKTNLNTHDTVKKNGNKSNLNIVECTTSDSTSDINSSLFIFGKHNQEKKSDLKTPTGFNFVFNSSSHSDSELKAVILSSDKSNTNNNLLDNMDIIDSKLEDKNKAELDSDNNNEDSYEKTNENSVEGEELDNQEYRQDKNVSNMMMVVKTIVNEFKNVITSFVKERIESEKKIAALEDRINTMEQEVENLKNGVSRESLMENLTNGNDTAKSTPNLVSDQPPLFSAFKKPSPIVVSPDESSTTLKKSCFGSTSSMFGNPSWASASTNNVARPSSRIQRNMHGEIINQNGKNLASEQKKANPQKFFSHEAVTKMFNVQSDGGMSNHLSKVNTGNPSKKMTNGQEGIEQIQNMPNKESFESHLQRTIETSVKKVFEEYWENFKSNTSEDDSKKFNFGKKI